MTITHSDVSARTGGPASGTGSYTTGTNPSSTQVAGFITAAKNIVKGENGGTTVDESVQEQIEIVLDVVEILVHNFEVTQKKQSSPSLTFPPEEKRWPTMNDNIRAKIANAWTGSRSGMEHVTGTTRYWK